MWVQEDDVLYNGDLRRFVQHFTHNPAHLITACLRPVSPDWVWQATNSFNVSAAVQRAHAEHVVRFSALLLRRLSNALAANLVLYGEAFAPTLCEIWEDCRVHDFRSGFVGLRWRQLRSCQHVCASLDPATIPPS